MSRGDATNASRSLLLAPHHDDESLFAAFTVIRERPDVIVCYRSRKQDAQGVTPEEREAETAAALEILGAASVRTWPVWDTDRDPVDEMRIWLASHVGRYERVYAPAVEDGGHDQHNLIGELAAGVFGAGVTHYLTYTNGRERSRSTREVEYEPDWIGLKLRALACYRSQHGLWSCAHHFLAPQLEFYAA